MNICLINPSGVSIQTSYLEFNLMSRYFTSPNSVSNLGLGQLHSFLEKEGHHVVTIEMQLQEINMADINKIIDVIDICNIYGGQLICH